MGERAALRGPKATRAAIVNDFYVPKVCYGCSLDLFCIQDVMYFVCPICGVVSPMTDEGEEDSSNGGSERMEGSRKNHNRPHGACTGFTFEALFEMQAEIMKDESTSGNSR